MNGIQVSVIFINIDNLNSLGLLSSSFRKLLISMQPAHETETAARDVTTSNSISETER